VWRLGETEGCRMCLWGGRGVCSWHAPRVLVTPTGAERPSGGWVLRGRLVPGRPCRPGDACCVPLLAQAVDAAV